jgi:hypothetical protein
LSTQKVHRDKQRSTKHTYKTKDRVTRTPLRTGCELRSSGREGSSWCTSGIRRVNLVTNSVIIRELGKAREVLTTSGTYPWSCVTHIFHSGQPSHGDFNLTKRNPWFSNFLVSNNPLSKKSLYTPYVGAAGMLQNINGKFTMGKFKSSLLS